MCCFYQTSNTINLVTATKCTAFWVIEYCIFMKDLVDCSATTHGVIFAKYVAQITKQQGRYAGFRWTAKRGFTSKVWIITGASRGLGILCAFGCDPERDSFVHARRAGGRR